MSKGNGIDLQDLYENEVWTKEEYRGWSPGEEAVTSFLEIADPGKGVVIIDWGCGTGRASKALHDSIGEFDITMVDFAPSCLDDDVRELAQDNDRLRFVEQDITQPTNLTARYGFCVDVMEHLREEDIDDTLEHILGSCKKVFFQICTADDKFSEVFGTEPLHLTVQNYGWWAAKFLEHEAVILRSAMKKNAVMFYVTGWGEDGLNIDGGHVNTEMKEILANMAENSKLLKRAVTNVVPHDPQDTEIMLLAGGPSLNDHIDEITEKREAGMPLVTTNGSYNWAIDHGLSPSLQLVIDAREFNKRFTELKSPYTDKTKFLMASQCNPKLFEGLPVDEEGRVFLWQVSINPEMVEHIEEHYGKQYEDWYPAPGGSTVMLRAFPTLRMLGYHKIHVYGFDSCIFPGEYHHAYEQKENDGGAPMEMMVAGDTKFAKQFLCNPWMVYQAIEFKQMASRFLQDVDLQVHGRGMIAYLIEAAAAQAEEEGDDMPEPKGDLSPVCYAPLDRRGNVVM
jgi:hypothetical protein